jgi:hypothetical protein
LIDKFDEPCYKKFVEVMFDYYNTMGVCVVLGVMGIWDHGIKLDMLL